MPLTPETLPRHELVGLPVRVADAPNPDLVGIEGRVVRETMRTLVVGDGLAGASRVRQVPKPGSTFEFALTDALTDEAAATREGAGTAFDPSAADGESVAYVTVDGARLLSRPALRTETTGDSKWR
jgi:ribonuclease P protein subunit POP4